MIHKAVTFGGANILKTEKQKVFILNVTKGMMGGWVAGPAERRCEVNAIVSTEKG